MRSAVRACPQEIHALSPQREVFFKANAGVMQLIDNEHVQVRLGLKKRQHPLIRIGLLQEFIVYDEKPGWCVRGTFRSQAF